MKQKNNTGFNVTNNTLILNQIRKNNRTLELLDNLQNIIEEIGGRYSVSPEPLSNNLIYKDKEGDEFDKNDFWDSLNYFVDINQNYMFRESNNYYKQIK